MARRLLRWTALLGIAGGACGGAGGGPAVRAVVLSQTELGASTVGAEAAAAPAPACSDSVVTMWVDVAGDGQCTSTRHCSIIDGRAVAIISAPADNCGFPPATWQLRNCEGAPVTFGQLLIARRDGPGAWQVVFDSEIARVAYGESRAERLLPLCAGRYDVTTTVTRGAVIETIRSSFEIPAPRMVIEGPAHCGQ